MEALVFASASRNTPASYLEAAKELGRCLAAGGHLCINGGGNAGCMGGLNESAKEAGGRVRGIIHKTFIGEEKASGLTELIVVGGSDLVERKRRLFEGAECIIALPGGVGTLDELFMAVALVATKLRTSFCGALSVCGMLGALPSEGASSWNRATSTGTGTGAGTGYSSRGFVSLSLHAALAAAAMLLLP